MESFWLIGSEWKTVDTNYCICTVQKNLESKVSATHQSPLLKIILFTQSDL